MADPYISSDPMGEFQKMIREIMRRLSALEAPTGTQFSQAVKKILALFETLDEQVAAAIAANSYTKPVIDSKVAAAALTATVAGITGVMAPSQGGTGTGNVYGTTATGSQLAVYVKPDGGLTVGASSERFKQFIADWGPDLAALASLPVRSFEWRDYPGETDIGLIAEEAYAAGLHWLVRFDGPVIEGIRYERLSVALLAAAQDQQAQITDMEARLARIEEGMA